MFGFHKNIMESGRSSIEMPTTMIFWVIMAGGAIALFNTLYAAVIANSVQNAVVTNVVSQQHNIMAGGSKQHSKFKTATVHGIPIIIETDPTDNFFTITLDLSKKQGKNGICNRLLSNQQLLQRSNSGLLLIATDGIIGECPENPQQFTYYFASQPGSGNVPTATVADCPQKIVLPKGAIYNGVNKTISCLEGYEKQGNGCAVQCVKCTDTPDKHCWNNQRCVPCHTTCSNDEHCTGDEHCSDGYCCPNGLTWSAQAHECLEFF